MPKLPNEHPMTMRLTLPLIFILASAAANAAEQPGTLSKEATQAGPAVDTSKTNVTPSSPAPAVEEPKPAAQPTATSQRAGGPQAVVRNDRLNLDTTAASDESAPGGDDVDRIKRRLAGLCKHVVGTVEDRDRSGHIQQLKPWIDDEGDTVHWQKIPILWHERKNLARR